MSLFDSKFDHIEHAGVKGMRWGQRKSRDTSPASRRPELTPEERQAAVNQRRMELRAKAKTLSPIQVTKRTAPATTTTPKPTAAKGGKGRGKGGGSKKTEEEKEKEKKEKEEKGTKGKAKTEKPKEKKPEVAPKRANADLKAGKRFNKAAEKHKEKISQLEKKLRESKKTIRDKDNELRVQKMIKDNISYDIVGVPNGIAASSGVLGSVLKQK